MFVIILWFYLFFRFEETISDFGFFNTWWVRIIISFGLAVFSGQIGLLKAIVEFFGWLVFSPESWWLRSLIFIAIIVFLVLVYRFTGSVGKSLKKAREETEKTRAKLDRGVLRKFVKILFEN